MGSLLQRPLIGPSSMHGWPASSPGRQLLRRLAAVLKAEGLYQTLYINQVETAETRAAALALAAQLEGPVLAGSLQKEAYFTCSC